MVRFIPEKVAPDSKDKEKGVFKRYFVQDTRNNRLIEVSKESYYKFTAKSYIKGVEINWIVKGPKKDELKGKYKFQGAESKNRQTTETYNNILPGLKDYIKDYGEFVE
jgi:hypothetical protein